MNQGMPHLMVDGYGIDVEYLADEALILRFLAEIPVRMGMQVVYGPIVAQIDTVSDPFDAGLSGFVIIATSHVSIHAWPGYGMVNIDGFSCNAFDENAFCLYVSETFHTFDLERGSHRRALRSPRSAAGLLLV
jgi:S-adenosylmethionine decarboxylase